METPKQTKAYHKVEENHEHMWNIWRHLKNAKRNQGIEWKMTQTNPNQGKNDGKLLMAAVGHTDLVDCFGHRMHFLDESERAGFISMGK